MQTNGESEVGTRKKICEGATQLIMRNLGVQSLQRRSRDLRFPWPVSRPVMYLPKSNHREFEKYCNDKMHSGLEQTYLVVEVMIEIRKVV